MKRRHTGGRPRSGKSKAERYLRTKADDQKALDFFAEHFPRYPGTSDEFKRTSELPRAS